MNSMPFASGTRLGPYEPLAPLSAGGMGEVYKATDTACIARSPSRPLVSGSASGSTQARAIAALNHPNICTLHDVGPNFLVMELMEGPTLAERIAEGAIPLGGFKARRGRSFCPLCPSNDGWT
jgi:serine/threonine protein kinase